MDRDLVEQAQRGDREAFAILARTRGNTLFGIARRILRDVGLAEDAVQQSLVIAWRELPRESRLSIERSSAARRPYSQMAGVRRIR